MCVRFPQWSTVEPGIGIATASIACLRPLFRVWFWRLGLADPPRDRRYPTYRSSNSGKKRKDLRERRRSLSPSDLIPTTNKNCTKYTELYGSGKKGEALDSMSPTLVTTASEFEMTPLDTIQTVTIDQASNQDLDLPPRVELRDSFRNSFTRGTVLGKFRIPA